MTICYFTASGNCLYVARRIGGTLLSIPQLMTNVQLNKMKKRGKKSRQIQTFSTLEPLTRVRLYRLVMLFTYQTLREAIGESAL